MTQQLTCDQRIDASLDGLIEDLERYMEMDDPYEGDEELGPFHEYGLCFDYVAPHTFKGQDEGYWRFQISWGGPSSEVRFFGECEDGRARMWKAEYWFLDWFDGACRTVTRHPEIQWLWDQFADTETASHTYEEAMRDYEPPIDEDESEDTDD